MQKKIQKCSLPKESAVSQEFPKIDYLDAYQLSIHSEDDIDQITATIFKMPKWILTLLKMRNSIVKVFGLKTAPFALLNRTENEVIMGNDDKHLIFRVSVFAERKETECIVTLTTIVHFHNIFGRFYFMLVKPFHKKIVQSCLKQLSL